MAFRGVKRSRSADLIRCDYNLPLLSVPAGFYTLPSTASPSRRPPLTKKDLYGPLQPWQTRLIKLLPATSESEEVACGLHLAEVTAAEGFGLPRERHLQGYEAVSYSWGNAMATAPIRHFDESSAAIGGSTEDFPSE